MLVLGLGVSNRPLVRLLLRFGIDVTGCDRTPREKLDPEAVSYTHLVLVDPYETSSRAELITLQPDGSVLAQLSLSFMPVSLSACGSYVGILTAEKALLYTSALVPVAETEQDGTAVCILARSDGTALLAGTGMASLFLP